MKQSGLEIFRGIIISSQDLDAKGGLSQSFVGWLKDLYGNNT